MDQALLQNDNFLLVGTMVKTRKKYTKPKAHKIEKSSRRKHITNMLGSRRKKAKNDWSQWHHELSQAIDEIGSGYAQGSYTLYSAIDSIMLKSYQAWQNMPKKNNMDDEFNDLIEFFVAQLERFKESRWESERQWRLKHGG